MRAVIEATSGFDFRESVCSVCGSSESRVMGWRGGDAHHGGAGVRTRIVRCRNCSHIYPNPLPYPNGGLEDLYREPDTYFDGHGLERKKQQGLERMRRFEELLGRKGRYLDVGCGRGELLWAAREAGWECDGMDPSPEYIAWGREHLGVEGRVGLLEEQHYPDASFDAVSLGAVIEHLYDPYATLSELWRVLKPGGVFWFDAPNEDGLFMRAGNLYMKLQGRDWVVNLAPTFNPFHVQGFNPRSLRQLLSRVGFEVVSLRVWGSVWPFTGKRTLRKTVEYQTGRLIAWFGNCIGAGSYMDVWARKPSG